MIKNYIKITKKGKINFLKTIHALKRIFYLYASFFNRTSGGVLLIVVSLMLHYALECKNEKKPFLLHCTFYCFLKPTLIAAYKCIHNHPADIENPSQPHLLKNEQTKCETLKSVNGTKLVGKKELTLSVNRTKLSMVKTKKTIRLLFHLRRTARCLHMGTLKLISSTEIIFTEQKQTKQQYNRNKKPHFEFAKCETGINKN